MDNIIILVIGCIDGTHFGLLRPSKNEHIYYNKKGFHSLNSMIVSDWYQIKMFKIIDIYI